MGPLSVVIIILVSLILGLAIGFCAGFLIFSIILKSSNSFGKSVSDDPQNGDLVILAREDKIRRRGNNFEQFVTYNMQQIIATPAYHAMMDRAVKNPDSDKATHV